MSWWWIKTPRYCPYDLLSHHEHRSATEAYAVDFLNLNTELSMSLCNSLGMFWPPAIFLR